MISASRSQPVDLSHLDDFANFNVGSHAEH